MKTLDQSSWNMYRMLFLFLLVIAVLIMILIFVIGAKGNQCLASPINYGLKQLDKDYDTHSQATVSIGKQGYASWIATADSNIPILTYSDSEPLVNVSINISILS